MPYNHLYILLQLYPDKPWDWAGLSQNPNITWEIIQAHPDKPWDYDGLSINPNIIPNNGIYDNPPITYGPRPIFFSSEFDIMCYPRDDNLTSKSAMR